MRESGYYWVKTEYGWEIAEYFAEYKNWYLIYIDDPLKDGDFEEIDEHKIERP